MAKLSFSSIASFFNGVTALNGNFSSLASELQDKVLYRNNPAGEPNSMQHDLDMNGYNILNVGGITGVTTLTGVATIVFGTQRDGTGTHSLSVGDIYRVVEVSASSSVTACINIGLDSGFGVSAGDWVEFVQIGVGPVKIVAAGGVTLRYPGTPRTSIQYGKVRCHYKGSDLWYLSGDLSAS